MSVRVVLTSCVACCCLPAGISSAPAQEHVQALPPSTAADWQAREGAPADVAYLDPPVVRRKRRRRRADLTVVRDPREIYGDCWTWQLLPEGLMFHSYLAGTKEPRFASKWVYVPGQDWLWDTTLGGRVGILRYGTQDALRPQGFQADIEGAAFPRLTADELRELVSADFRFGIPLTYRSDPWEYKFAYYHLSSHLGDEYMLRRPSVDFSRVRINYTRDALVLATAYWPNEDIRMYAEAGWAFHQGGGSKPWEFQFGITYSTSLPTGFVGSPFLAVNAHLHQELGFGGNLCVQTGWQWRGMTGRLFRVGAHYYNGKSDQYEFLDLFEEQIGFGIWYDF